MFHSKSYMFLNTAFKAQNMFIILVQLYLGG